MSVWQEFHPLVALWRKDGMQFLWQRTSSSPIIIYRHRISPNDINIWRPTRRATDAPSGMGTRQCCLSLDLSPLEMYGRRFSNQCALCCCDSYPFLLSSVLLLLLLNWKSCLAQCQTVSEYWAAIPKQRPPIHSVSWKLKQRKWEHYQWLQGCAFVCYWLDYVNAFH